MYKIGALFQLSEFIIFNFFSLNLSFTNLFLKKKTNFNLINFYEIFPMQSSEFMKSLNFESNLKKKNAKKLNILNFHLKIDFDRYQLKKIGIGHILKDLN